MEPNILDFVEKELGNDLTGHSYMHAKRVAKNALLLASREGGDKRVIEAAAWLHDCADEKLYQDTAAQKSKISAILKRNNYKEAEIAEIMTIIDTISFHKEKDHPLTSLNAQIVSDADKLEAIGAIGIIRTIEYGARKGRPFYEEKNLELVDGEYQFKEETETTLTHFYQKLLRLGEHFYTATAKEEAEPRMKFLRLFVQEFYRELEK
jgi:uncharacterized protein